MSLSNPQFVGWATIVGGVVSVVGFISLLLLFVVGEPFGTLNDILSVPVALLLMPLVLAFYRLNTADHALLSLIAAAAGFAGFFISAAGSILLVLGHIDFQQSLVPGIGGFGLIGLWVLLNSVMGLTDQTLPRGLAWAGLLLSLAPTLALMAAFRADSVANVLAGMTGEAATAGQAGPLVYLFVGLAFISYAGLPFWFIGAGRIILAGALESPAHQLLAQ